MGSQSPDRYTAREHRRIAMDQEHDVAYWCEIFAVTRDRLEAAVNAVGPSSERVQEFLAGPSPHTT